MMMKKSSFMSHHQKDFALSSYEYTLPQSAIAQSPTTPRESAKLLVYERDTKRIVHSNFYHFCEFVPKDTLIVLNDTKVLKARIYAKKLNQLTQAPQTKLFEIFIHKAIDSTHFLVQIKGRVKCGDRLLLEDLPIIAYVQECLKNGMRIVYFTQNDTLLDSANILKILETYGHIPLPPYIKRKDTSQDEIFYQSVFASSIGSVAAPTASLHFSTQSLEIIRSRFDICFITLHIGAGTFMGVESEDIRNHHIHTESYSIPKQSAKAIDNAKNVLCVGTTAARCVEYYTRTKCTDGECDIFLYPSIEFKRVDYLLTNFHLPKSTLLMLISAMIGRKQCLELYAIALKEGYKFYSYGDGMLIL